MFLPRVVLGALFCLALFFIGIILFILQCVLPSQIFKMVAYTFQGCLSCTDCVVVVIDGSK